MSDEIDNTVDYYCKSPYQLYDNNSQDRDERMISIRRPGPGTCCPGMNFVDGICTSCGCVLVAVCQRALDRACIIGPGQPGCFGRLDCEGYAGLLNPRADQERAEEEE